MTAWFRRNWWALLALVPVFVATFAFQIPEMYASYWKSEPREPVSAPGGTGGTVTYAGARMRLASLAPVTDLTTHDRQPFQPPSGTRVWQATIEFEAAGADAIGGCSLYLEDDQGRTYESNPSELSSARVGYASCLRDIPATPSPTFQTVAYFVLPASARATAVRITIVTQLPRYARLTTG
jgi:hypothetical protein